MPAGLKKALRLIGVNRVLRSPSDKRGSELAFQVDWAYEFAANKSLVCDYWKRYRFLDDILGICSIDETSHVLDVGCGISTVLHFVPGIRTGVDPLAGTYKKIYDYPSGIEVIEATGESLPFENGSFDVAFCTNVLDHVSSPTGVLSEIRRVLRRKGYFILTVEVFEDLTERSPAHPHCFSREDVFSLAQKGFETEFAEESPWISLRAYVNGSREYSNKELVMVLKKVDIDT